MKKVLTIIIICVLFITTGILAYTTYNLYQENQELQEDIDDLKYEKKTSSSKNDNNSNKGNTSFKEENKDNTVNNTVKDNNDKQVEEDNYLVEITMDELQTKIDNKEKFILLVSQTECPHCLEFKPKFKRVLAKYNVIAYNIEIDKLTKEEYIRMNNIAYTSGTPTTIFFENGAETNTSNRLIGSNVSSDKIVSRLKDLGYIK